MTDEEKKTIRNEFANCVNMAPQELEDWLETSKSKSVGDSDTGESTGHEYGRHIVKIRRTHVADLSEDQYHQMRKVVGYAHRHLAQRPDGDIEETNWRYSLMNWGHDPLKT
ncbi:DUF3140 domain-containing protein [Croceicoccus sp. F390]|uniref:DUF3140 domain-containing protein n=1 Tax=Croceicoccus esteveae TaxID=3075597 RepID=A0ABU2ZHL8_9SPHN|nr:DUF3140 domain-containing protein [Croceicoccus sp. F390]MDT0574907.1 DUF3140 domain-containing protein [Croceicoccus sp. F390]